MSFVYMLFMQSILSIRLKEFDLSDALIGYIFAMLSLTYAFGCALLPLFITKVHKKWFTFFSMVFISFSCLMFGPSAILRFPNSLSLLLIGFSGIGIMVAFIAIPQLPEIINAVCDDLGIQENTNVANKGSSTFNIFYAIGAFVAPMIGGLMGDSFGFRVTCDLMGLIGICFAFTYLILNIGIDVLVKRKRRKFVNVGLKTFDSSTESIN